MKAYFALWRYGYVFSGRTNRRDFLVALLVHWLVTLLLLVAAIAISFPFFHDATIVYQIAKTVNSVYGILMFVPCITITVRRLCDAGYSAKSFWWLLVPGLGGIAFIARLCGKSVDN